MLNCFPKHFPAGLSLCIFHFFFYKGKDTFAIPQLSAHHLLYVFSIFFCFHECFNNFYLCKNLLTNKFFHWNMCLFIFLISWSKGVVGFSLKLNNPMRLKTKRFLFILADHLTEIWEIIVSAIKNERSHLYNWRKYYVKE